MIRLFCCLLLSFALYADKATLDRVEACLPDVAFSGFEILKETGMVSAQSGFDLRDLQQCFEHVIACQLSLNEIDHSIGAIHLQSPDDDLCTPVDIIERESCFELTSRAQTLQSYLSVGGVMMSIYPKCGIELRSLAQQAIYCSNLQAFPHHLIDVPLLQNALTPDLVGLTYLLTYPNGKQWLFSVQMDENKEDMPAFIWYGPLHDVRMLKRLCAIGQLLPIESLFTAD